MFIIKRTLSTYKTTYKMESTPSTELLIWSRKKLDLNTFPYSHNRCKFLQFYGYVNEHLFKPHIKYILSLHFMLDVYKW